MGTKKHPEQERVDPVLISEWNTNHGGRLSEVNDRRHCPICGHDLWCVKHDPTRYNPTKVCPGCSFEWWDD